MELSYVNASGRYEMDSSQKQVSNNGRDIISDLPNHIIGSILSFLPTKVAVRTCVLSKRWKNLWTFVRELSFQDHFHRIKIKKMQFVQFVYRVLRHLDSSMIDSFSLSLCYNYAHIKEWISLVLSRKVKKVYLEAQSKHQYQEFPTKKKKEFPTNSLFECQYLQELCLKNFRIRLRPFITLSSLTVLKLSRMSVTTTFGVPNEPKDLTLNFPVLRKFETEGWPWYHVKSVTLQMPLLDVLSMDDCRYHGPHVEINYCVSHLIKFNYTGRFLSATILVDAVDIVSANINIMLYDGSSNSIQEQMVFVSKLLSINGLNAASLKLCLSREQVQDFGKTLLDSALMPGCFLLTLKVVKFERFAATTHDLNFAEFVLKNAMVLEKITFSCSPPKKLGQKKWKKVRDNILSYTRRFSSLDIKLEIVP
ncbi:F-box/FBD/LRR-repeat protein At3g14710-like isoform X2 [Trifolium pratense]|uniref:F-box/FBD/LRR-repeat protein At3g14710-like isoform X2 n=1 Tax=Trifolium pratense TaxID=57577 RepID=UPI001E69415D|nr:F-box/FBD/LRR-repeat protein At3g14710-like isoform X2 [Trifolium pratense]